MAINKVIYDGDTLMDVTDSTVNEENLLAGTVAYNAAGERITGAVVTTPVDSVPTEGSDNAVSSGGVFAAIGAAANVTASKVKFTDGETFQQKYNSGELTGPAGEDGTSVTVKSVSESGADGGSNVVTFSDGKTLIVKNGSKGSPGTNGSPGAAGKDGATFTPSVDASGNLSWSNNGGLGNPATVNIKGPAGADGAQGPQGEKGDKGDKGDTGASTIASRHSVTLPASGWTAGSGYAYEQFVSVSNANIATDTDFDVDVDLSGTDAEADAQILAAFGLVTYAESHINLIEFACAAEKPEVNIPLIIRIYA